MTERDLEQTLASAVAGGRIGTPVSLRAVLPAAGDPPREVAARLLALCDTIFESDIERLYATQQPHGAVSVLVRLASGAMLSVTALASVGGPLELLLVGNHGILQLEGEDELTTAGPLSSAAQRWETRIADSLQRGEPLAFTAGS